MRSGGVNQHTRESVVSYTPHYDLNYRPSAFPFDLTFLWSICLMRERSAKSASDSSGSRATALGLSFESRALSVETAASRSASRSGWWPYMPARAYA